MGRCTTLLPSRNHRQESSIRYEPTALPFPVTCQFNFSPTRGLCNSHFLAIVWRALNVTTVGSSESHVAWDCEAQQRTSATRRKSHAGMQGWHRWDAAHDLATRCCGVQTADLWISCEKLCPPCGKIIVSRAAQEPCDVVSIFFGRNVAN
jgi:hypothetical protein